ncbi:ATP-binding protein [Streptomyces purpureus]|nr:ATP-binding protein [Streptomyces purpureus]
MTAARPAASQLAPCSPGHAGYTVGLSCLPPSAALARMATRTTAQCWGLPEELTEDLTLIASELVTNAVKHAASSDPEFPARCRLTVERPAPDTVRVEVLDSYKDRSVKRRAGDSDESGRGLFLVEALATSWGVTRQTNGKTVWAVLKADT